jgi:DNA-binding MarR family transcriptional regulator
MRKRFKHAPKLKEGYKVEVCGGIKPSIGGGAKSNRYSDIPIEPDKIVNASKIIRVADEKTNLQKNLETFMEILEILAKKRINMKQMKFLSKIEENEGMLYYQLVDKLSQEEKLPKSTVRWNLKRLRETGMIIAGCKDNKGVPVKLTEKGRMALLAVNKRREEFLSNLFCPKSLFNLEPPIYSGSNTETIDEREEKLALKNARNKIKADYSKEKLELSFWYETRPEGP